MVSLKSNEKGLRGCPVCPAVFKKRKHYREHLASEARNGKTKRKQIRYKPMS